MTCFHFSSSTLYISLHSIVYNVFPSALFFVFWRDICHPVYFVNGESCVWFSLGWNSNTLFQNFLIFGCPCPFWVICFDLFPIQTFFFYSMKENGFNSGYHCFQSRSSCNQSKTDQSKALVSPNQIMAMYMKSKIFSGPSPDFMHTATGTITRVKQY